MKRIVLIAGTIIAAAVFSVAFVSAQQPPQPEPGPAPQMQPRTPPPPPEDPLGDAMFPPEMIMQHQRELNLTLEQKTFMRNEIQKTTTRFNELQWQLQDAVEALHETMKSNAVNEQQALSQLDKVLDAEREIKRLHIGMGIRIKNQLTAEQQTKLQSMRHMMGHGPDGPRLMRGPGWPGMDRHPGFGGLGPEGPGPRPDAPPAKPDDF